MTAQYHIYSGYALCHLEVNVHAVVGQNNDQFSTLVPERIHHRLALVVSNAKTPVFYHVSWIGETGIGERLADNADSDPIQFTQGVWFEYLPGLWIISWFVVERGVLSEHNVLRKKLDGIQFTVDDRAYPVHAIGEFPMAGHNVDTQQLTGANHVPTLGPQRRG